MKERQRTDRQEAVASGRVSSPLTRMMDAVKGLQGWNQALAKLLTMPDEDMVSITIMARDDGVFLIGKRYWETEQKYVCFVDGETVLQGLNNLASKWYARDAWKVDKPWQPRGGAPEED